MSLQVCGCGWSKVTTYHGLRTHQGKMGCTPRGMGYLPEITFLGSPFRWNKMDVFPSSVDVFPSSVESDDPDLRLRVCGCGWSKVTTYHGLRTHQGKKGCTASKGFRANGYSPQFTWTESPIQLAEPVMDVLPSSVDVLPSSVDVLPSPVESDDSDTSFQVCGCGWSKVTTYHGLRIHQEEIGCTGPKADRRTRGPGHRAAVKMEPLPLTPPPDAADPAAADPPTAAAREPFFQTPVRPHPQTANKDTARRALTFSAGGEEVRAPTRDPLGARPGEHVWAEQVVRTPPTTAVRPRGDEDEKEREAENLLLKAKQDNKRAELKQKIQIRELKMEEVKLSMKGFEISLDSEWLKINNTFSEVVKVVEDARQKALRPLEDRRRDVKRQAEDLLQRLEREADKLEKAVAELDGRPEAQTSVDELTSWNNTSVDTSVSFGSFRTTMSAMMEQIQLQLEELSSVELNRIQTFAVDVKLDPATAHPCLALSDDGKRVRDGQKDTSVPDSPQRFDAFGSVLGLNGLTSGRSYWEVEVGDKTGWDLGVARGDANRKGKLSLNPGGGYWATVHYEDSCYAALTAPPSALSPRQKPRRVGVFVDRQEGLVSFYDAAARSHLFSFTGCSLSGEIFPYFSPHLDQNGENSAPLIISSGERQ